MPLYLSNYDCMTPAGHGVHGLLASLDAGRTHLVPEGRLTEDCAAQLLALRSEKALKDQDRLTLMALCLARGLPVPASKESAGVLLGSSRGPTETLEVLYQRFDEGKRLSPSASPSSTASALPAAVARDIGLQGPSSFISAACSTGLMAVIHGASLIQSGLADAMLVGGSEAANTPFTQAMLQAARVSAPFDSSLFPCRPGADDRKGMVLSEGAALLWISKTEPSEFALEGMGLATESATLTGVSAEGDALQKAIRQALRMAQIYPEDIDLIVGHGAGTERGDAAELSAYAALFTEVPPLLWAKWCVGHMLGASAALSLILGCESLKRGKIPGHPYLAEDHPMRPAKALKRSRWVLVTSMGFGGSAGALLVRKQTLPSEPLR